MPAQMLIPALFVLGIVIQLLMLRFARDKKRFYLIYISLGVIVPCETVGRLDNGLAEIIVVVFTWALLLGALFVLAAYGLYHRIRESECTTNPAQVPGTQKENWSSGNGGKEAEGVL